MEQQDVEIAKGDFPPHRFLDKDKVAQNPRAGSENGWRRGRHPSGGPVATRWWGGAVTNGAWCVRWSQVLVGSWPGGPWARSKWWLVVLLDWWALGQGTAIVHRVITSANLLCS
jgi:hypothetical protein